MDVRDVPFLQLVRNVKIIIIKIIIFVSHAQLDAKNVLLLQSVKLARINMSEFQEYVIDARYPSVRNVEMM